MNPLEPLLQRRSVPSRQLGAPGPTPEQLDALLAAACRVPDHGRLVPWRFLIVEGEARIALGAQLAERALARDPALAPEALDKERQRFSHAPLVVTVVARIQPGHRIPEQEQLLTAGCVCFALLQGAQALGFGAQWLTGWAAYDPAIAARLGLQPDERIAGFIHIGSVREQAALDRPRPAPCALVTRWTP